MHGFLKRLAAVLAAAALSGCGPSLKPGENFYPYSLLELGRNPDIVINHLGPKWTLWVEGQDRTAEFGLSVDDSQLVALGYLEITVLRPNSIHLSPKFQLAMYGGVKCQSCSEETQSWHHATVAAN